MTKDTNTINIFEALWNNDIEAVKTYINNGGDVNARDKRSNTPLMWVKNAKMTKPLLDAGADVNAKNVWGETALMQTSCPEIKKLLKSHGAVA